MKQPPFPSRNDVIQGYSEMLNSSPETPQYEESFWSYMIMRDLTDDFPHDAFSVIIEILAKDSSFEVIGNIAAGPVEDLLTAHGPEMIDEIEAEARKNPVFNEVLGGVWKSTCMPEVWARVEAVRKNIW